MIKIKRFLIGTLLFVFGVSLTIAPALATETSAVSGISVHLVTANAGMIEWTAYGTSANGFKVVWSKNRFPVYPTRDGDQYHYFSDSSATSDTLDAFAGSGTYNVRVCAYNSDGTCGVYSNQITISLKDVFEPTTTESAAVKSITLASGEGNNVIWTVNGTSAQGFKVVWSKNENPTYPTRDGDQYHYYSELAMSQDVLQAFNGAGVYFVRVCEYLGGKCGVYSNQIKVILAGNSTEVNTEKNSEGTFAPNPVSVIVLSGTDNNLKWTVNGFSINGFKVVWSKNENPVYPTKEGDKYHYRGESSARQDWIEPFAGNGTYFVRVCAYENTGVCSVYSNQIQVTLNNAADAGVKQISEIRDSAQELFQNKLEVLLAEIKSLRDMIKEQQVQINHLAKLKIGLGEISSATAAAINNFIAYGVDLNTKKLGEGERAAVMYSYKAAFDKLPTTEEEMEDAIKIANGRFPSIISDEAEASAKAQFEKIYLRAPDMNNAHDAAAVKVMAYGLRQKAENRNLKSESSALKSFKAIFKRIPKSTEDWNALQAITYSGATR